jgi:hypothetical protein
MTSTQRELFDKINSLQLDECEIAFPFSKRLARENGWSHTYSKRVIDEYKKFIFLAIHSGHLVAPSDQVDQAWHLHLTYTKSYWEDLCESILNKKLHHHPTKGGNKERLKFTDFYNRTLESYQLFFTALPPTDIWPPVSQRFNEAIHFKRVNTKQVWLLPKPKLPVNILSVLLITSLASLLFACSANPVASGIGIGISAILGISILVFVLASRSTKQEVSRRRNRHTKSMHTSSGNNDISSDSSSSSIAGHTATAAGLAGFAGGEFGGGGAGGDYGDTNSGDSGRDSGSSGCSSGCGGGSD